MCQIQATDPAYSLISATRSITRTSTSVFDYVKQTRDGFLNVAKMPGPHDMPYELDTTATRVQLGGAAPRHPVAWCSRRSRTSAARTRRPSTSRSTGTRALRKPITDRQPVPRRAPQPFPVIFPLVQAELDKQSGQPVAIAPEVGLDPTKYENFAITNDALDLLLQPGRAAAGSGGRAAGVGPAWARRRDDRLSGSVRRERVHLTVAGGRDHPAVVADRHSDREPGRAGQRIGVHACGRRRGRTPSTPCPSRRRA